MSGPKDNPAFEHDNDTRHGKNVYSLDIVGKEKAEPEVPYDPYKNRKVTHPTTNAETFLHLLKGSMGTGILAMPNAFRNSGYILGIVCTAIIGFLCTYCIHLLVAAEYALCKRRKEPSMTYPRTASEAMKEGPAFFKALSTYMGHVVNTFLLIYQIGTCSVYIIFVASNIQRIVDNYMEDQISIELYCLMILVPLILLNWVRNLKYLAPFSTVANGITIVAFVVIFYYIFKEGVSFKHAEAFGELASFPLYFGTVLFALEAIGVIMPLENEMKEPQYFGKPIGILNLSMSTIVALYILMGLLGYLAYPNARGSITLDLPDNEVLAQVIQGSLAAAIFITYALQCYVAVDIVWNMYLSPKIVIGKKKTLYEYITRTIIVLVTFGLAVAIPKLDLFISLFGALCLAMLGIAIPAMVDLSTNWYHMQGVHSMLNILKNTALIIFGIIGLIVGTYTAIDAIVKDFAAESKKH